MRVKNYAADDVKRQHVYGLFFTKTNIGDEK
jgi:hypothetical protein